MRKSDKYIIIFDYFVNIVGIEVYFFFKVCSFIFLYILSMIWVIERRELKLFISLF